MYVFCLNGGALAECGGPRGVVSATVGDGSACTTYECQQHGVKVLRPRCAQRARRHDDPNAGLAGGSRRFAHACHECILPRGGHRAIVEREIIPVQELPRRGRACVCKQGVLSSLLQSPVIGSIARGDQRLNCSMRGSMELPEFVKD